MGIVIALALIIIFAAYQLYRFTRPIPPPVVLPRPQLPAHVPLVSFLVPAWNDGRHIPEFVAHYHQLSYPHKELILCVGGQDGSWEIAKSLEAEDVQVIQQKPGEGKQVALRHSYPLASGDIIYLTDIDCRLNDDTVNNLLSVMLTKGYSAVTGSSRPLESQIDIPFVQVQWAIDQQVAPKTVSLTTGILGRNAAVSREALDAIEAFNDDVPAGTDYFLAKKLIRGGMDIRYIPGYPVGSEYPDTVPVYIHKQARWIRNVFVLGRQFHNKHEVQSAFKTLMLPIITGVLILGSLILALMGATLFWPVATLALLVIFHSYLNRELYLKHAKVHQSMVVNILHWYADTMASLNAGWQILRKRLIW